MNTNYKVGACASKSFLICGWAIETIVHVSKGLRLCPLGAIHTQNILPR